MLVRLMRMTRRPQVRLSPSQHAGTSPHCVAPPLASLLITHAQPADFHKCTFRDQFFKPQNNTNPPRKWDEGLAFGIPHYQYWLLIAHHLSAFVSESGPPNTT